jgi:hypothetical protein
MNMHKPAIIALGAAALFFAHHASALVFVTDSFSYADVPLAGNGTWARGINSPASDNPSDHIVVENGAVKFDWTTATPVNNVVRSLWAAEIAHTGQLFAFMDFSVSVAPQAAASSRPGFLSFADSAGSQQRGYLGIKAGSVGDTFQLGISPGSQLDTSFTFSPIDLQLNTTYQLMFSYDSTTTSVGLWVDNTLVLSATNNAAANAIRRVNLRMYNSDGGTGTTNLGVFSVDNLTVTTVPEPRVYALLSGLLAIGLVIVRRRRQV